MVELTIAFLRSIDLERYSPGVCISVIVVDTASGDASQISAAIVENGWCSWVSLWVAPKNGGFAYGNNQGLRMAYAKGAPDYFFLLNPDTEVRRGAIKVLVSFLEAHPEVGIAGSSLEGVDGVVWPGAVRFPSLLGVIAAATVDEKCQTERAPMGRVAVLEFTRPEELAERDPEPMRVEPHTHFKLRV